VKLGVVRVWLDGGFVGGGYGDGWLLDGVGWFFELACYWGRLVLAGGRGIALAGAGWHAAAVRGGCGFAMADLVCWWVLSML